MSSLMLRARVVSNCGQYNLCNRTGRRHAAHILRTAAHVSKYAQYGLRSMRPPAYAHVANDNLRNRTGGRHAGHIPAHTAALRRRVQICAVWIAQHAAAGIRAASASDNLRDRTGRRHAAHILRILRRPAPRPNVLGMACEGERKGRERKGQATRQMAPRRADA